MLYVTGTALLAAALVGFTVFLLIRGFQWRAALADLRAEPGIEILSVERVGFFKKRLLGLRDPLAPDVGEILRKHNIGPASSEVVLTEYHSLNTIYAMQREESRENDIARIRDELVASFGEYAEAINAKREEDLEKITRMLFEAKFPQAMKSVDLEWRDGAWHVHGELYAPEHEAFVERAPRYIVEGELNFDDLENLTETGTSSLRHDIETANLLATDIDGRFVHVERVRRLVLDYDEICARSGLSEPRLQLEVTAPAPDEILERLSLLQAELQAGGRLRDGRFLPRVVAASPDGSAPVARLHLVPVSTP